MFSVLHEQTDTPKNMLEDIDTNMQEVHIHREDIPIQLGCRCMDTQDEVKHPEMKRNQHIQIIDTHQIIRFQQDALHRLESTAQPNKHT